MESKIIHLGKLKCHPGKIKSVALVRFDEWSKIFVLNPETCPNFAPFCNILHGCGYLFVNHYIQ